MQTQINPAARSKINWTSVVMLAIGLAVAFDLIPPAAQQPLTELTLILGPALIATFRTWFTG